MKGRLVTLNISYWNHKNCFVNLNLYTTFNAYCPKNRNGPKYNSGVKVLPNVSSGTKEKAENIGSHFSLIPLLPLMWRFRM